MVVDDLAIARVLRSSILRADLGGTLAEAAWGADTRSPLERQSFDVRIPDVLLPVLDGIATLEAGRRHRAHRTRPAMT